MFMTFNAVWCVKEVDISMGYMHVILLVYCLYSPCSLLGRAERYLVGGGGGGGELKNWAPFLSGPLQTFFDLNVSETFLIFNTFRNFSIPGPPLGKLGSFFDFSFGWVLHPSPQPHPPVVPALPVA